jgi:hypothetical protein
MNAQVMVPIFYTCHGCGVVERELKVIARNPGQSVIGWMSSVYAAVGADHMATGPQCTSRTCDLKAPLASKSSTIGEAVRH